MIIQSINNYANESDNPEADALSMSQFSLVKAMNLLSKEQHEVLKSQVKEEIKFRRLIRDVEAAA